MGAPLDDRSAASGRTNDAFDEHAEHPAARRRSAEPEIVGKFAMWWKPRHSTLCALNATGHRGPCTCRGAKRV